MTASERLDKAAAELEQIIQKMIADVPEPEAEEVERGIKRILDYILNEELDKPIDKMKTEIIDSCLDVLVPNDESQV